MTRLLVIPLLVVLFGCSQSNREQKINRVHLLHLQADTSQVNSKLIFLQEAHFLLSALPEAHDSLRINNHYRLGEFYRERGIIDSAAIQFFNATVLINDSISKEAERLSYYHGWESFYTLKRYGDCLTLADKFLSIIDKKDYKNLALGYYFKENVFKGTRQFDSAYHYNEKRISALSQDTNKALVVPALISRSQYLYFDYGDTQGTFAILDSIKNSPWNLTYDFKRQLYGLYGVYLFYEDKKSESLNAYLKGLDAAKQIPDSPDKKTLLAYPYANISEVLIDLGQYQEAKLYLDSAVALGFSNIDRTVQNSLLKYKFNLASKTNSDAREVVQLLDSVLYTMDAQYQNKFKNELSALSVATKNEQQLVQQNTATQIENLKLQTRFILVLFTSLLLVAVGIYFLRKRNQKFAKMQLQMQQRLLRTQMNPHYTSNSLYAIGRTIKKSPEKATEYLIKFSRQLRQIMENSLKNKILLSQEIDVLKGYLDLQKYRLEHGLEYSINMNDIDQDDPIFVPPMLIQPFVENAIEHGFKNIDYLARISIDIRRSLKTLICTIEDNGVGLPDQNLRTRKDSSTTLISDFLKKTTKKQVVISNNTQADSCGVIVKFEIPYTLTDDH